MTFAIALAGAMGCAAGPRSSTPNSTPTPTQATTNPTTRTHEDTSMTQTSMTKATMIPMTSVAQKDAGLRTFLKAGRDLVAKNEPDTPYWYALEREGGNGQFAIFDLFPHQAGRDAHFNGDVASALAQRAPELVDGGWDDGVVANVQHYQTIAQKLPDQPVAVTKATAISLQAAPGKADALAEFLTKGCAMVIDQEPLTPYWLALRSEHDDHRFAIVDFFPNQEGRQAHFEGQVAAALKANAHDLVVGGWEAGVIDNVVHFDVVAAK
ncbi:MAG: hypothetical protein AAGF11_53905 [Myxococcota bacterium]